MWEGRVNLSLKDVIFIFKSELMNSIPLQVSIQLNHCEVFNLEQE